MAAVCSTVLCRVPTTIRLKLEGGKQFEMTPPDPTPIVTGSLVTVYPGETVFVEASLEDGVLTQLTAVPEVTHPDRTLVFELRQDPSLGDGTHMILRASSPFPGVLKYRLGMMLPSTATLYKTSSCPLRQGLPIYEHWPHPIFQLVATGFTSVDPSSEEARTCE